MPKKHIPKTASQRLLSVNETKMKCIEHDLTDDLATKVLFKVLDKYHKNGTQFIGKELKLSPRHMLPRKYVINLYNDRNRMDTVLIRALDESDEVSKPVEEHKEIKSITDTWIRDKGAEDTEDTEDTEINKN